MLNEVVVCFIQNNFTQVGKKGLETNSYALKVEYSPTFSH